MTRFIHDKFAKDYLEELLKPYGEVRTASPVSGEIKEIDVLFSPYFTQNNNLEILGLLGQFATTAAIFEPFRNAASKQEICDCLLKQLELRGALRRKSKRDETQIQDAEIPKLWVLTPTASTELISSFNAHPQPDSLTGVYYLGAALRTAIVAIHQLPCIQETLWLRILGRGKVQKRAVDELEALPIDHPLRKITLELLYNLQRNLRIEQNVETDDRELIMRLAPLYQQDREQAIQEGIQQGIQREQRLIIRLLNRRFGELEEPLIERVKKLSIDDLESLGEAFLDFQEISDLIAWLNTKEELKQQTDN
ncbi:MAG TPA: DUF4351 domain-containing protein [Nostocaceae cyanobacterium]|nr:DUF4351 domain-containing protein [Nostocaceae cyanobacterium]